jgi:hypothetical protein
LGSEHFEPFHARELNENVLKGPRTMQRRSLASLTEPESPHLLTKERAELKRFGETQTFPTFEPFKARPMPSTTTHWQPIKLEEKELTEPEPFRLLTDERGNLAKFHFEEKIKERERRERAMRRFKARPMPVGEPQVKS